MKLRYIALGFVLLAALLVLAVNYIVPKESKACFRDKCFTVELAVTPEERAKGLMNRERLDADRGMLFVFEKEDNYPFWMKNTKIPLDIIWMDENKEVVYVSRDTQPCTKDPCPLINPGKNARYVLEVSAGTADLLGLREGDNASFYLAYYMPESGY